MHQRLVACNFGRRLKTLKGLTPYEFICKAWAAEPLRFNANPHHQMPGLNNYVPQVRSGSRVTVKGGRLAA